MAVASDVQLDGAEAVIDAIFGTGLTRRPEGRFAEWIEAINSSKLRVISVDVPSGLDADSGVAYAPCVQAHTTVTLGLPKPGVECWCTIAGPLADRLREPLLPLPLLRLLAGDGPQQAGEVWLADIGVPFEAYAMAGVRVPPDLFSTADRVRLDPVR